MAYETIIVEIADGVALITLDRPDALNALNSQLLGELATAVEDADASDKVRCIVLTGSDKAKIIEAYQHVNEVTIDFSMNLYGSGNTGNLIVAELNNY